MQDDCEETDGAFVHWNIDNDDSSDNSIGGSKRPGGDFLQSGTVADEDDLKPFLVSLMPELAEGFVSLAADDSKLNIWNNGNKGEGNLVVSGAAAKTWNLSNPADCAEFAGVCSDVLWVEGIGKGSCVVELPYSAPASGNVCDDKVKYTFIAADCGRQPRTDSGERKNFEDNFPNLVRCEWGITGEDSRYYNCLAWAVGKTDVWVNDIIKINGVSVAEAEWDGVVFWGIDKKYGNGDGNIDIADIDNFFLAEADVVPTTSVNDASIIYYAGYHAARRKNCDCGSGCWDVFESKCGEASIIEHMWNQLEGDNYGSAARFYRHRR